MRLENSLPLLRAVPLFAEISGEALRLLAFSATTRSYRAGDTLFRRGEGAEGAFLIVEGQVVLDTADNGGPSGHVLGPGTLIGQTALFARVERPATALARSAVTVLAIPRDLMLRVLDADPDSAAKLHASLARQTAELARAVERVGTQVDPG
jgi:CRP-like cAMP-binding protein